MKNREFSDAVKLKVVRANLEKHCGSIGCDACGCTLSSISECHFDHIYPYSKGGSSTVDNCQLLCMRCNLKKRDTELREFVLSQKARAFLEGESLNGDTASSEHVVSAPKKPTPRITREIFAELVRDFIEKNGNICRIDFMRENNGLPSFHYVKLYYGGLNALKKEFGIENISQNWDRESIERALTDYVAKNGNIHHRDMKKDNGLPSVRCVLHYYPEYKSFVELRRELCGVCAKSCWTCERAIELGREFARQNGGISERDLGKKNSLPSAYVVRKLFGTVAQYKRQLGAEVCVRRNSVSRDEITAAVERYFEGKERVIESQKAFCESFEISLYRINKSYGVFSAFCEEYGIKLLAGKKGRYSRREVDDFISKWVKLGNDVPNSHELAKHGLPSRDVILKYYENWREPFYIYKRLYEELNRHS